MSLESSHELSLIPTGRAGGARPLRSGIELAPTTAGLLLLLLLVSPAREHMPSWSWAQPRPCLPALPLLHPHVWPHSGVTLPRHELLGTAWLLLLLLLLLWLLLLVLLLHGKLIWPGVPRPQHVLQGLLAACG